MIKDKQGREVRVQLSKDKKLIDLYLGQKHKSPTTRWNHRVFDQANTKKLATRINQLVPKLKK